MKSALFVCEFSECISAQRKIPQNFTLSLFLYIGIRIVVPK